MSFGFSATDIIVVGNLAWKVYQACKDCPAKFQVIANEASATHAVMRRLNNELDNDHSMLSRCNADEKQDLMRLVKGLQVVLEEIYRIIEKYHNGKRIPNSIMMAKMDLNGYRTRLTFYFTAINSFTDSLARNTLARIETVLLKGIQEVRQGRRADPLYNMSAQKELGKEMAKNGVSARNIAKYGPAITTFLLGHLSSQAVDFRSLGDIALPAIRSHGIRAIRDGKASSEEETSSSEEDTSSDEGSSSDEESLSDRNTLINGESFNEEKSFDDKGSFTDEASSSDEEASSDEDGALDSKVLKLVLHKSAKYAKIAIRSRTVVSSLLDLL